MFRYGMERLPETEMMMNGMKEMMKRDAEGCRRMPKGDGGERMEGKESGSRAE